jgi:hypothetical protein
MNWIKISVLPIALLIITLSCEKEKMNVYLPQKVLYLYEDGMKDFFYSSNTLIKIVEPVWNSANGYYDPDPYSENQWLFSYDENGYIDNVTYSKEGIGIYIIQDYTIKDSKLINFKSRIRERGADSLTSFWEFQYEYFTDYFTELSIDKRNGTDTSQLNKYFIDDNNNINKMVEYYYSKNGFNEAVSNYYYYDQNPNPFSNVRNYKLIRLSLPEFERNTLYSNNNLVKIERFSKGEKYETLIFNYLYDKNSFPTHLLKEYPYLSLIDTVEYVIY